MLAGRPAFGGRNAVEILHATLYEQPPALTGSPAVAAADRVIRRALAKRPRSGRPRPRRWPRSCARVRGMEGDDTPALARALTRLVVLPFRILRPDPETDFLAFSLPDAIATSLSRIGSLVVRSSATAARFAGEAPDLKALAAEADVDRVVMGTLVRSGDQLRAAAQLVEAPGGTLAHVAHGPVVARRPLPAAGRHRPARGGGARAAARRRQDSPTPEAPHNARAYALYLQANELGPQLRPAPAARELYQQCLELDPGFAPAWAQLGRCHRVIGKFIDASRGQRRAAPRRPSAAPSSSTRGSRWRTSTTRTSRRRPASRGRRSCACWARPTATATTPSCSRGSSTPAATAGSSSSRSPRTRRRGGSTRTCPRASSRRS